MKRLLFILLFLWQLPTMVSAQKVGFSQNGGFYDDSIDLTLSCDKEYHIRYTIDGNAPTASSALYKKPLKLDPSLYSTADIYKIQISPDNMVYVPDSVRHAIVIRAALFDSKENLIGDVATNTYLIRSLGADSHGMAVVSVCADHDDLFNEETGIFVRGINWRADKPDHTGNYYQHGSKWERPANVEFYEPDDNSGINQMCGLRTHGNRSRRQPAKGMKIYARSEYGKKKFKHEFFKDSDLTSYKHLILKPFASFWPYSGVQDYVSNKMALQLDIEAPNCRPVQLYLNGEYWGIYFIQEKTDDRFLEDHCEVAADNINIIGSWKGELEHGNDNGFKQMMKWFKNADLTDEATYTQACDIIDMHCYIDYMVFQTFAGNFDWPGNNTRLWQEQDGKWRWIFFDGDATIIKKDFDVFTNAAVYEEPSDWLNYPQAKLLFGKLLQNKHFRKEFKSRAKELCNGMFKYNSTYPIFHEIEEALRPHIADQKHRFGYPSSIKAWEDGNNLIDSFLKERVDTYLKMMDESPLLSGKTSGSKAESGSNFVLWLIVSLSALAVAGIVFLLVKKSRNNK